MLFGQISLRISQIVVIVKVLNSCNLPKLTGFGGTDEITRTMKNE